MKKNNFSGFFIIFGDFGDDLENPRNEYFASRL